MSRLSPKELLEEAAARLPPARILWLSREIAPETVTRASVPAEFFARRNPF